MESMRPECPICFEVMNDTDLALLPCPCDYQVCLWCLQRIRQQENNRCPQCRREYEDANYRRVPISALMSRRVTEETDSVASSSQHYDSKSTTNYSKNESRRSSLCPGHETDYQDGQRFGKHPTICRLYNCPPSLLNAQILSQFRYLGKYGRLLSVVICAVKNPDRNTAFATYAKEEDAVLAQQDIAKYGARSSDTSLKGIRFQIGAARHCIQALRGMVCANDGCPFIHGTVDKIPKCFWKPAKKGPGWMRSALSEKILSEIVQDPSKESLFTLTLPDIQKLQYGVFISQLAIETEKREWAQIAISRHVVQDPPSEDDMVCDTAPRRHWQRASITEDVDTHYDPAFPALSRAPPRKCVVETESVSAAQQLHGAKAHSVSTQQSTTQVAMTQQHTTQQAITQQVAHPCTQITYPSTPSTPKNVVIGGVSVSETDIQVSLIPPPPPSPAEPSATVLAPPAVAAAVHTPQAVHTPHTSPEEKDEEPPTPTQSAPTPMTKERVGIKVFLPPPGLAARTPSPTSSDNRLETTATDQQSNGLKVTRPDTEKAFKDVLDFSFLEETTRSGVASNVVSGVTPAVGGVPRGGVSVVAHSGVGQSGVGQSGISCVTRSGVSGVARSGVAQSGITGLTQSGVGCVGQSGVAQGSGSRLTDFTSGFLGWTNPSERWRDDDVWEYPLGASQYSTNEASQTQQQQDAYKMMDTRPEVSTEDRVTSWLTNLLSQLSNTQSTPAGGRPVEMPQQEKHMLEDKTHLMEDKHSHLDRHILDDTHMVTEMTSKLFGGSRAWGEEGDRDTGRYGMQSTPKNLTYFGQQQVFEDPIKRYNTQPQHYQMRGVRGPVEATRRDYRGVPNQYYEDTRHMPQGITHIHSQHHYMGGYDPSPMTQANEFPQNQNTSSDGLTFLRSVIPNATINISSNGSYPQDPPRQTYGYQHNAYG
eukprot:Blabericola_migrator_1__4348@NODE_233_length_11060_cov_144_333303_g198_i0_p1_GENE_NODE_233_length_11060_cov_144_333303_g198_i0NODE_233_length_11060_cov_144_333303_g198_i0_p1_ORF_typecomplete_len931_score196_44zfRING_4/PF14570_6/4_7e16zfC3HC4_3/PF13920_6/8_8e07zfRING_2/PF13639_6/0_0011zfC3HC4_2/PF13923_6/0_0029zfUDP/PF14569_6/0_011zfRING_5/PF14634_6/0_0077Rtf2/PF04641_12/0_02zfC3HC4/PF00097_25/0_04ProkRING_4/PF14447_6/0_014ProkRING_4/PF14447_6/4_1e03RRM_1/PF00076_22/0_18zfANAPC11/PF12861_7/0_28Ba